MADEERRPRWRRHPRSPDSPAAVRRSRTVVGVGSSSVTLGIEQPMAAGRVRVDGELVTDLDIPAPAGTRVVIWTE